MRKGERESGGEGDVLRIEDGGSRIAFYGRHPKTLILSVRQLIEVEVDLVGTGFDAKGSGFEGLAGVDNTETIASEREARERNIIIRFGSVELEQALGLAHQYNTYAYDAYMLACALRYSNPLLSLDARLNTAARAAGITVMEVTP